MSFSDGARLMRASVDLVRRDRELLWFPIGCACCLALTAGFWLYEGFWLYAMQGTWFLYVPLVVLGMYSLVFVGAFFSVALAGATAQLLERGQTSFRDGLGLAWGRVGPIAGWAGYSVFVALVIGFVSGIKGLRWIGKAAEVAWNFATFFVVPLIAIEGLNAEAGSARSSSRRETGRQKAAVWAPSAPPLRSQPRSSSWTANFSSAAMSTRQADRLSSHSCSSAGSRWEPPLASSGRYSRSSYTSAAAARYVLLPPPPDRLTGETRPRTISADLTATGGPWPLLPGRGFAKSET